MKELAKTFLQDEHPHPAIWVEDTSAKNLFIFLYHDGLSVGDYKPYMQAFRTKSVDSLSLQEVSSYLTALAKHDRVSDCYSSAFEKGSLKRLLQRYLALIGE